MKTATTDTPRTDYYYAGKGCECSARNRSECGCDVDWTDPRIYELQAEVERLRELLSLEKNGHEGTKKICDKILDSTRKTPSRAWHRANKKIPLK